jgi:hypothetical protein
MMLRVPYARDPQRPPFLHQREKFVAEPPKKGRLDSLVIDFEAWDAAIRVVDDQKFHSAGRPDGLAVLESRVGMQARPLGHS